MNNDTAHGQELSRVEVGVLWDAPRLPDDPTDAEISEWAYAVLRDRQALNCEVAIKIVTEDESQALNSTYRHKDAPTNVLSFPLDGGLPDEQLLLGDLAICSAVVRLEARSQGKPLDHHMAHMVVHGVLHLLGFDHVDNDEAHEMEQIERDILRTMKIPDPYELEAISVDESIEEAAEGEGRIR